MAQPLTLSLGQLHGTSLSGDESPIRAEIYSVERLEQYASSLAVEHKVTAQPGRTRLLLPRLEENGRKLVAVYHALAEAIRDGRSISPASEWLVDNFHIVEEQLREIREDLPRGYYKELPKLDEGELEGYPRIYVVALALIAHTDSHLESELLQRFIEAYQKVTPLTIGEGWAIAITLRLALVENLRRLALQMLTARREREEADALADWMLEQAGRQRDNLLKLFAERLSKREKFSKAFVAQLSLRLREQDPAVTAAMDWLEENLLKQDESIEQVVHIEHQRQAASQVTVGNIITSMRLLSTLDWRDFFESVSLIDVVLGEDPAGIYARMDFATRDRYRHVIEGIGRRTKTDELIVGRRVVEMALKAQTSHTRDESQAHIGYYLVDDGLSKLEKAFAYRPHLIEGIKRAVLRHPTATYLGSIGLLTLLVLTILIFYAWRSGAGLALLICFALLSLVPASDLAVSILNWDLTHHFGPRLLPKIDNSAGIPEDARTMVVIPTLFTGEAVVTELLERLEVHYLANQDEHIYFALLGDYADAEAEELPTDTLLLEAATAGIERLNKRYSESVEARFYLFHRRRLWNESEGKWLGWERKRGKLQESNRLLRGVGETSFTVATAGQEFLSQVR